VEDERWRRQPLRKRGNGEGKKRNEGKGTEWAF
jgi:hypothetical protein